MVDFKAMLRNAGFINKRAQLDRKAIVKCLGISERTLERWLKNNKPTQAAINLLNDRIAGCLPQDGPWSGFYICRDGLLWTPDNMSYDAAYIRRFWITQQSSRFKDATIVNLRAELAHLKNLANSRDQLRQMGNDLIDIATKYEFNEHLIESLNNEFEEIKRVNKA